MKRRRSFCCYCGGDVFEKDVEGKLRDFCGQCQAVFYENPLPVAASIVVNDDREVLLVKRDKEPYKGMWCLPIGFAESDEEVREAALRELKEETGLEGELVRLIDVDTVDNYFYGSLAIVTYEVQAISGCLQPGDDAAAVAYHPIDQLPSLAWISNEKAVRIYTELYQDTWAMLDSFKHLFPEQGAFQKVAPGEDEQKSFLSNILVKLIERDLEQISESWLRDLRHGAPKLIPYVALLLELNRSILQGVQPWLRGVGAVDFSCFLDTGMKFKAMGVPLPDMVIALALSRRAIWLHVVKKKILSSPLEIYTTLELNNRIIFFYDKVFYAIAEGYFQ
jgi:8-oxo-dGTP diphosphatase